MLKKGAKVTVKFQDKQFSGVISVCHKDNTYDVDCEDGDSIDKCAESDITVVEPEVPTPEEIATPPAKVLTKEELEHKADVARKDAVDDENVRTAKELAGKLDSLADTPLSAEEKAFCKEVAAKMNCGLRGAMPPPNDILKYSQLRPRLKVK